MTLWVFVLASAHVLVPIPPRPPTVTAAEPRTNTVERCLPIKPVELVHCQPKHPWQPATRVAGGVVVAILDSGID